MIDLTTYALLRKQITTAASGISDVRAEGDELVFVLADGHEVRMAIPATEIRDAVVRDDVLVLTLEDDKEVVVDATLTQSGQAADAKVTGDALALKLTEPSTGLAVGKYFRISAIDNSGHAVLEAVDLPIANDKQAGMVQVSNYDGWYMYGNRLQARTIDSANFAGTNNTAIIGKGTLNGILSTPSVMPSLTAEEQAAARKRMGFPGDWELIERVKITEEITKFYRDTEPDGSPYKFAAMIVRADFSGVASDTSYGSSTYCARFGNFKSYDYFTSRTILRSQSLYAYIDCTGKCINSNTFIANNSGVSLVTNRLGFMNTVGIDALCQAFEIGNLTMGELFPAGVIITIWGVRM